MKAGPNDFLGRFREIISDPINLLIERHSSSGMVDREGIPFRSAGAKSSGNL